MSLLKINDQLGWFKTKEQRTQRKVKTKEIFTTLITKSVGKIFEILAFVLSLNSHHKYPGLCPMFKRKK